ncbi:hypothetical protein [Streptomyces acidicola]|uniref:Uncharacterized protein n=2 Tax=Actinomycetes TaxID=1760 RepID=A0A5N8X949_9ACTN|nr:hypothetical protein [Streptomyces acidicola]MPY55528.1 hypothetical protein [Streptomyces acidicola]
MARLAGLERSLGELHAKIDQMSAPVSARMAETIGRVLTDHLGFPDRPESEWPDEAAHIRALHSELLAAIGDDPANAVSDTIHRVIAAAAKRLAHVAAERDGARLAALRLAMGEPLTAADVSADPEFWISGAGRKIASRTDCGHGYNLTDSCPGCDAAAEHRDPLPASPQPEGPAEPCGVYNEGWSCTEPAGHTGRHRAHNFHTWDQQPAIKAKRAEICGSCQVHKHVISCVCGRWEAGR